MALIYWASMLVAMGGGNWCRTDQEPPGGRCFGTRGRQLWRMVMGAVSLSGLIDGESVRPGVW